MAIWWWVLFCLVVICNGALAGIAFAHNPWALAWAGSTMVVICLALLLATMKRLS